jgi:hypothetical protein
VTNSNLTPVYTKKNPVAFLYFIPRVKWKFVFAHPHSTVSKNIKFKTYKTKILHVCMGMNAGLLTSGEERRLRAFESRV